MEKLTRRKFMELTGAAAVVAGASSLTGCCWCAPENFKLETAVEAAKVSGVMNLVVRCVEGNSPLGNEECHIVFNSVRADTGTQWNALYRGSNITDYDKWIGRAPDGQIKALLGSENSSIDILYLPDDINAGGDSVNPVDKIKLLDKCIAWLPTEAILSEVKVDRKYKIGEDTYYAESFVTADGQTVTYCSVRGELKYLIVESGGQKVIYEAQLNFQSPQVDDNAVQGVIDLINGGAV